MSRTILVVILNLASCALIIGQTQNDWPFQYDGEYQSIDTTFTDEGAISFIRYNDHIYLEHLGRTVLGTVRTDHYDINGLYRIKATQKYIDAGYNKMFENGKLRHLSISMGDIFEQRIEYSEDGQIVKIMITSCDSNVNLEFQFDSLSRGGSGSE